MKKESAYLRFIRNDPCAYCGGPGGVLDHVVARQRGGPDGWDNRCSACPRCNGQKRTASLLGFLLWLRIERDPDCRLILDAADAIRSEFREARRVG